MTIVYNLEIDDWVAFQEYFKEKKTLYKYLAPLLIFSAVLITTINIAYLFYQEASLITLFSFILVLIVLYLLYLKSQMRKQLQKTAKNIQSKNPDAFGPREMDFNDRRVDIKVGDNHKILTWEELSGYEENNDYFFLYSQKGMVYIIPKRDLNNITELEDVFSKHLSKLKK